MKIYKNKSGNIIDINEVKDKYFSQWPIKTIAKHYSCSWQQIGKIIWKEIPKRRLHKYKYEIDHTYFKIINTEEKAYIFGFICADGSISRTASSNLSIALQYNDKDGIDNIKAGLKSTSPIVCYSYKGRKYYRINFYSKQICDDLKKHGCGINKTIHLKWNNIKISSHLMCHFIRGYFDGDGCLSFWMHKEKYLKCHWNITSTNAFIQGLQRFIFKKFGYSGYISQRHKNNPNTKTIELSGNKQITSLMKWMYNNETICLQRKKYKYDNYLRIYEKRV